MTTIGAALIGALYAVERLVPRRFSGGPAALAFRQQQRRRESS